jgi:2-dehydropantoate 2-reductase
VLDEVLSVAHAHGVAASAERVGAAVRDALDHHRGHQPSMLQDLLAGRPTETGAIHGAVLEVADRLGMAVPVTRTLHALVSLSEKAGASR